MGHGVMRLCVGIYHFVRGQSTIKLYVLYNVLEVGSTLTTTTTVTQRHTPPTPIPTDAVYSLTQHQFPPTPTQHQFPPTPIPNVLVLWCRLAIDYVARLARISSTRF